MNLSYCSFTKDRMDEIVSLCRSFDQVVTCRDFALNLSSLGRVISLRHDVDNDMDEVPGMLEWEIENGLVGTYYFQHDLEYFGTREMLEICHQIEDAGGEVGIHNNAIAHQIMTGELPIESLTRAVETLRDAGLHVCGTSSHGHQLCHDYQFTNAECFKQCVERYKFGEVGRELVSGVRVEPFDMTLAGFLYQIEDRPGVNGTSDVGGELPDLTPYRYSPRSLVILMHPQRWPV